MNKITNLTLFLKVIGPLGMNVQILFCPMGNLNQRDNYCKYYKIYEKLRSEIETASKYILSYLHQHPSAQKFTDGEVKLPSSSKNLEASELLSFTTYSNTEVQR